MAANSSISRRIEFLLLAVVLIVTAVLRTSYPSLTEFKGDEARLTLLALEMAEGTAFPIRGISSSVGFPNFPMSVWLYSLPLLLWKHVYAATIFTGVLNTLAVFDANQWQQTDLVVSAVRLKWADETTAVRTGMYTFPEKTAVSLYDVAGNLAGESLEIPLP